MKIVVYKDLFDELWHWRIENEFGMKCAESWNSYTRKSDAKRGATRFEQSIFDKYWIYEQSMPIEVEK